MRFPYKFDLSFKKSLTLRFSVHFLSTYFLEIVKLKLTDYHFVPFQRQTPLRGLRRQWKLESALASDLLPHYS